MPYAINENGNIFLDENGDNIEYNIEHIPTNEWYKHREGIYINDDNNLDTEDRYLVIKDGINSDHAISKKQLNQMNANIKEYIDSKLLALQSSINTSITALFKAHEAKILTQMINFRNEQIKNRIQRKYLKIPKKINTWIKLFDNTDVGEGVLDLKNVIIMNVWIKKYYRFHNSKSSYFEKEFDNSIQFYYNNEMTGYFTYFGSMPGNWSMDCFVEWLRIPQPISIDSENISESKLESKPESNE